MSQLISYPDTVHVGEEFTVTIKEKFCRNCSWEAELPRGISLISQISSRIHPQNLQQWVFAANAPGTYTIKLYYRKRCCGRPIIQREFLEITVI